MVQSSLNRLDLMEKTAAQILHEHSPNKEASYETSWIIGAMEEHTSQYKSRIEELEKQLKDSCLLYQNMVGTIESQRKQIETLTSAIKTVVDGYEGDGMERMFTRDTLFYKVCKAALNPLSNGE